MNKTPQLFYNKNRKKYYCDSMDLECNCCNAPLKSIFYLTIGYAKNRSPALSLLCSNCKNMPALDIQVCNIQEQMPIHISAKIPANSEQLTEHSLHLIDKFNSMTIFEAVTSKESKTASTTDRTILSGRESFEGSEIGLKIEGSHLDNPIKSEKECLFLLENISAAEPLIEDKTKIKLLNNENPKEMPELQKQ